MQYSFLYLKIVKIHFHGVLPLVHSGLQNNWTLEVKALRSDWILSCSIQEAYILKKVKKSGFTFSIELGPKLVWSHDLVVDEKHLSFIIGIKKKLTNLLKILKASEAIPEIDYKKLKPRDSNFGVLYGLCKTREKVLDKCPPFISI